MKETYKVRRLGLFGLAARRKQGRKSDIYLLVEFEEPVSLFQFLELEEHLSKILRHKVDLVMKKALKPALKKQILQEAIFPRKMISLFTLNRTLEKQIKEIIGK